MVSVLVGGLVSAATAAGGAATGGATTGSAGGGISGAVVIGGVAATGGGSASAGAAHKVAANIAPAANLERRAPPVPSLIFFQSRDCSRRTSGILSG
jgi:hypothetical protein